jgi:hypothetical protein
VSSQQQKKNRPSSERLDLSSPLPTVEALHAKGKSMRERVPRESHGKWTPFGSRTAVLLILEQSNVGRQQQLIPLRMGRMAASPFAFLRGAAAVMAHDLSKTPVLGVNVVLDGDAHVSNFGLYGTAQRRATRRT